MWISSIEPASLPGCMGYFSTALFLEVLRWVKEKFLNAAASCKVNVFRFPSIVTTQYKDIQKSHPCIDHFRVTSHMTNCVFGRHVGGKTKKNKKSF